jgi:peroxiredoxin
MKHILISFSIFLLAACGTNEPQYFTVEGSFTHAAGKKIMLAELPFNQPQRLVLDSATLDSSGKFKLATLQTQEGMYQLFVENGPGILLINDTAHIILNANADSLGAYHLQNSKASQSLKSLYERITLLEQKAAVTNRALDSISKTKTPDSLKTPFKQAAEISNKTINDFLVAYLSLEKNATAQWYGLGVANHFLPKEQWGMALEKALVQHPQHAGLSLMKVSYAAAQQDAATGQALINKPVPDISLTDTSGKKLVSVSSFKGKWLLIDFWASWCAPCRADNPNLLAAYRQYNKKNFTILGVSLDRDTTAWKKAIRKDSLSWTQVSDLKFWSSKAVDVYGFSAIPFNILVDTSGKAIAVNLHGEALREKLKSLLEK